MHLFNSLLVALAIASSASATELPTTPPVAHPVPIDRDHVTIGQRDFVVMNDGKEDGQITVSSFFVDDAYVIHDRSASTSLGLQEDVFLRLDPGSFAPKSVEINAEFGATHVRMNADFEANQAIGSIHQHGASDGKNKTTSFDVELPEGVFTRASALYLANAMPLRKDAVLKLNWFDSLSAKVTEITYTIEGIVSITVPAGTFQCFQVYQSGGMPENRIYVTTEAPRRIVRFDVVGQPMTLELLPDPAGG